jgi:hypothetical protein
LFPSLEADALTVCMGYADIFALTIEYNRPRFRRWMVVTGEEDDDVKRLCEKHGVEWCVSERVNTPGLVPLQHYTGGTWNKGCAVNDGMQALNPHEWVVILDADVLVPPQFNRTPMHVPMHRNRLYGCHRVDLHHMGEVEAYKADPLAAGGMFNHVKSLPGIGYFQLFHARAAILQAREWTYTEKYGYAGSSDSEFRRDFGPVKRLRFTVGHLYHGEHKANWFGRTGAGPQWSRNSGVQPRYFGVNAEQAKH